jgi:hypothetical protein
MAIFQTTPELFDLAKWERDFAKPNGASPQPPTGFFENTTALRNDNNQFILLQLSDSDQRVLSTSQIQPSLAGSEEKPDINMLLDFEGFKIADSERIDKNTKATLQLKVGQEQSLGSLDKLFYCINGGLDLYDQIKNKKADSRDFKKATDLALGRKPISLPGGVGQISLQVVKHEEPRWWQQIFAFAKTDAAKDLFSLVGFGGITETAVSCVEGMLDRLFDREPEILFQSQAVKAGFTQVARDELSGGLSTNNVSCLNPGYWVMARKADYDLILKSKPIYYGGYGILAPEGMGEIDALNDSGNNPFSKLTYAVIRARMKEVDLKQGTAI